MKRIDILKEQLNSKRPLTPGEVERLKEEFLIDFTYNSNAIEGNTLTLQETALIINEGITIAEKPLKDHLEVIGHKEAYFYVESLVKEKTMLTESIIRDIHSLVLMNKPQDKGVYRKVPVCIMGSLHEPPQPYLIAPQMEDLMINYEKMKQSCHIIQCAAYFHLCFESIHPFIDGNGRTGRLILNLELMKDGYPPINIKFADRRKYYDCFTEYHKSNGDVSALTSLIENYEEQMLQHYLKIIK